MQIKPKKLLRHQKIKSSFFYQYNNIVEAFFDKEKKLRNKNFLIFPEENQLSFSYSDFKKEFLNISIFLKKYNLKKGDKISIIFFNQPEFFLFYFSCLSNGLVLVPINPDLSPREIDYIINNSESKLVIYSKKISYKIITLKKNLKKKISFLSINSFKDLKVYKQNQFLKTPKKKVFLHDLAIIIYTSGTTGNPKGVVLSHLNLMANSISISKWLKFNQKTISMCIMPLFHNNGQIPSFLSVMLSEGTIVVTPGKTSILNFWNLIEKYKVTFVSIMPSILSILLNIPKKKKNNSLKLIISGGQVLLKSVKIQFEKKFKVPIFENYGLTETSSIACINDFPARKRKAGSIGKPLPTNEMAILDNKSGKILDANIEGEICIKGHNVAAKYYKLNNNNKIAFSRGWFHSGDFGIRDKNNYFYFRGRKDSLIIKGGENIYPAEIENVLYKNLLIQECAVIGIPDKMLGENICAFVRLRKDHSTNAEEIKENLKGKIAGFKQPKEIIILNNEKKLTSIPKGPTKKILYRELRKFYEKRK
jgi:acyl-CoA synthetase (AMP-forming)/AMP-acid ligase II